jgi:bifunctional DNA-binding transcriptional regulator/antitoxin component of YhaV-PrlF toxin-antitoxin module
MAEDLDRLDAIARPHATVSDKIRALAAAGVPRADIARFLGKRYQHVRNVLEGDAQSGGGGYVLGRADLSGVREEAATYVAEADDPHLIERRRPGVYWLRPRPDGSLVLPREVAEKLGLSQGRRVFAELDGEELKIVSGEEAMRQAQDLVCRIIPPEVDLASELLADRLAEVAREAGKNG